MRALPSMLGMLLTLQAGEASAAELKFSVGDGQLPLEGAVISLHSEQAQASARASDAVIEQIKSEFVPRVSVVSEGSRITFPNRDRTRHHVYSFSPAKRFEIPLYSGTTVDPVRFDASGVVTLGCNIHDWMIGYIVVVDTPYRAITDASGSVSINLPAGNYQLRVWHERLTADSDTILRDITVLPAENPTINVRVDLEPVAVPRTDDRLRGLQRTPGTLRREPD